MFEFVGFVVIFLVLNEISETLKRMADTSECCGCLEEDLTAEEEDV